MPPTTADVTATGDIDETPATRAFDAEKVRASGIGVL
jgi:hypothetical protein